MSAPLSPIIESWDSDLSHRPKTFQPTDASSKKKNRKSRIRYTGTGGSPWTYSTLNQPLPSKASQQAAIHNSKLSQPIHGPEVQRSRMKAYKHPNSLLISRPSFLGDFQTLAAYYQSESKSDRELQPKGLSCSTRTPNGCVLPPVAEEGLSNGSGPPRCKLPSVPNTKPALPPKLDMKGITAVQAVSQPETKSRVKSEGHGYANIATPQRATRTEPVSFKAEDSESTSSDLDHLPDSPPQLDLPFFGAGRHIGCRFSVRTLTREVERSLKSHEAASRKKDRKSESARLQSVHKNFKILNRTRKDLGMRPRHDTQDINTSGPVKPEHEFEDERPFKTCECEGPDGEACDAEDSELEWSDVERLFARLPPSIDWKERRQDSASEQDTPKSPQSESPSSFVSPSSEASPNPRDKKSASPDRSHSLHEIESSQRSALLHSVVSTESETHRSFHPSPAETKIKSPSMAYTNDQSPPKTPRELQLTPSFTSAPSLVGELSHRAGGEEGNLICSKALPVLVPQPWGRARGQDRNTVRYAPALIQSSAPRFSCATTTQSKHKETRKHFTVSTPTSSMVQNAQVPNQSPEHSLTTTRNAKSELSALKPVLKPIRIPGIRSPPSRHPSGMKSTTGLRN